MPWLKCTIMKARFALSRNNLLGQKSRRTKVSRIYRIFVPNCAPNFAPNFPEFLEEFSCFVSRETESRNKSPNILDVFSMQKPLRKLQEKTHKSFLESGPSNTFTEQPLAPQKTQCDRGYCYTCLAMRRGGLFRSGHTKCSSLSDCVDTKAVIQQEPSSRKRELFFSKIMRPQFRDGETTIKITFSLFEEGGGLGGREENRPNAVFFVGNAMTIKS